jgi:hypothetical protein
MDTTTSNSKNVLITGGTGLVGDALCSYLMQRGFHITVLTRKIPQNKHAGVHYALWNVEAGQIDAKAVCEAHVIIHLAGAGVVDRRWSAAYKDKIRSSRTESGALLCSTLATNTHQCKVFISASAIGWYGPDTAHTPAGGFVETAPAATDFLGSTCQLWESSTVPLSQSGIRLVHLRIGIVLSNGGGALAEFKKPLCMGLAAVLGGGQQMISWVHIQDLCAMVVYAIRQPLSGAYNAVAPYPVSNHTLTITLAKALNGKWFIPFKVPAWLLGIVMGESSVEVLKSCTVSSQKIKDSGFKFQFATINDALQNLLQKDKQ